MYPEKKYSAASSTNIAQVIGSEIDLEGLIEFIRRLIFNILIEARRFNFENSIYIIQNASSS